MGAKPSTAEKADRRSESPAKRDKDLPVLDSAQFKRDKDRPALDSAQSKRAQMRRSNTSRSGEVARAISGSRRTASLSSDVDTAGTMAGRILHNERNVSSTSSTPVKASIRKQSSSVSSNSSVKDSHPKSKAAAHPLASTAREIVKTCFDQPHADLGNRIQHRTVEKRADYRDFLNNVSPDSWQAIGNALTQFLDIIVQKIDNIDDVKKISQEFGAQHVEWKQYGFKPDFWVTIADCMTTECIYLDQAMHGQTEVLEAWSGLIGVVLSSVRDGYYDRLRRERKSSRYRSSTSQPLVCDQALNNQSQSGRPSSPTSVASLGEHSNQVHHTRLADVQETPTT